MPRAAVEYMAGQVSVDAGAFAEYRWSGRTIEYHRRQVRQFHGLREPTVGDEGKLIFWLAAEMCPLELSRDRLRAALLTPIFICDYLADEELRREIHEGLNVVENFNLASKDIFYGKDLTGDDRQHVEVSALTLHLITAAITYLNTVMIQIVLRDPAWNKRLSPADRRGLSALFWSHLNLYGRFELDMNRHLPDLLGATTP